MRETNPYWLLRKAPQDLHTQIRLAAERGFNIISQTPTTAQLVRNKSFSCLIATISFLFFGIGVVIYLFYFLAKRDQTIYLDVTIQPTPQQMRQIVRMHRIVITTIISLLLILFILILTS